MLKRFIPDQLTLFFVFSIGLFVLLFGSSLINQTNVQHSLTAYFAPENAVHIPDQGLFGDDNTIYSYDQEVDICYSLDGGESFIEGYENLDLMSLKNPDMKKFPMSFHQKNPIGNFPRCLSLVVYLKHKTRSAKSEKLVLTFFEEPHGELPVIALTSPQENLTNYEKGILIFGSKSHSDYGFYKNWWNRSANFQVRGADSERPLHFQFFESGKLSYEEDCGARISGNATRGFPQKSFQIVTRKKYGNEKFEYPFFGDSGLGKYMSLVIRNSGNDNAKTMFADLLMQDLAISENIFKQKGIPTVVYLNGNYWGIYNLRERIDIYTLSVYEDVVVEEITILEGGDAVLKEGDEKVKSDFVALMENVRSSQFLSPELYKCVDAEIDFNSFIDYVIFETYYANGDWPRNNSLWYKAGNKKWKWILNDLDYGLAYQIQENVHSNLFDKLRSSHGIVPDLFNSLMKNQEFNNKFKLRAIEIVATCFNPDRVTVIFNEHKSLYQAEIRNHINRWRMIESVEEWENNCQNNLDFLYNRNNIYLKQIEGL